MSLLLTALLLAIIATALIGPATITLRHAGWVSKAPRMAVLVWQSLGLSAAIAFIGSGLCVAVARFHVGFFGGIARLGAGLLDGHPLRGLGLPDALGLTLAADLAIVLAFVALATVWKTLRVRARHRLLVNLIARVNPGHPGTMLIEDPRAVAYCVPGIHPRIVVTTGALAALSGEELAAVLDHERGHIHGRHGLVLLPMTRLWDLFRFIPYATLAPEAMRELLEMAADDHAARRHNPAALASALLRLATPDTLPAAVFRASGTGVPARISRLIESPRTSRRTAWWAGAGAIALLATPVLLLTMT
ncbi:MAG TPA: M56 family metallopeptidase [Acidimicrobiales bacterium]|jgi:Zn-dependent protease with chaperone function